MFNRTMNISTFDLCHVRWWIKSNGRWWIARWSTTKIHTTFLFALHHVAEYKVNFCRWIDASALLSHKQFNVIQWLFSILKYKIALYSNRHHFPIRYKMCDINVWYKMRTIRRISITINNNNDNLGNVICASNGWKCWKSF